MSKLNGKDSGGYDKTVMVNAADVERSMLEVSLQCVRDNPDVRRPDGRKSPYMLCAEEAMRLRKEVTAKDQQLETLRARVRAGESALNAAISQLSDAQDRAMQAALGQSRLVNVNAEYIADLYVLRSEQELQGQSRWFRLGRWMGFYR